MSATDNTHNERLIAMEHHHLKKHFAEFDEILSPWLEKEGEFFAAVLLQTYAWWRGDHIDLGIDLGCDIPQVMPTDIASIVQHHADPNDLTFVMLPLPSLFQREDEGWFPYRWNQTLAEKTRAAIQQQTMSQGMSEIE